MTRASRRTVLKGAALAGVAASPALARSGAEGAIVFDSRIAESRVFAPGGGLDVASLDATRWAQVRAFAAPGRVDGLTGWSDWTALRGALEAQGWRVTFEERVPAPISRKAHLFRWTMARRGRQGDPR